MKWNESWSSVVFQSPVLQDRKRAAQVKPVVEEEQDERGISEPSPFPQERRIDGLKYLLLNRGEDGSRQGEG